MFKLIKKYPLPFGVIVLVAFIVLYMIAAAIFKTVIVLAILGGIYFYVKSKFFKGKEID